MCSSDLTSLGLSTIDLDGVFKIYIQKKMKTLITLIVGFIWNIIKVLLVGFLLLIIWPDIQLETVLAVIALYSILKLIYKSVKK